MAGLTVEIDKTLSVMKKIKELKNVDVLVGITEETSKREAGEVNNAQLIAYHTKGVMAKSMRREIKENTDAGMSYSEAHSLYIMSHGSPLYHIPPRPVIEPAITASGNKERLEEDLKKAGKAFLENDEQEAVRALHIAGMDAVNMIKLWFEDSRNNWPPLAESTIKAKGSDKPLQDTGKMRDAITYVVDIE